MMRHRLRWLAPSLTLALATFGLTTLSTAPAHAWGTKTLCDTPNDTPEVQHNNRWGGAFGGTWLDVYAAACISAGSTTHTPHLEWVRRPRLSFPTKNIAGMVDNLTVTESPWVSYTWYGPTGKVEKLRWRFSVKNCPKIDGFSGGCSNKAFRFDTSMYGTLVCQVKSGADECDSWKAW